MTKEKLIEEIKKERRWLDSAGYNTYNIDVAFASIIKKVELQESCDDCCNGNQTEKAKLCQRSYLAGMEHKLDGYCVAEELPPVTPICKIPFRKYEIKIKDLPSAQSNADKCEYHTDHTDCIWYGNDSGCPATCSQYRDGWNDAMNYIFKDGKGYQPYRQEE